MKPRTVIVPAAGRPPGRRLIGVREGRPVVLRDGSVVLIRQVRGTDAPLLADGFARLSAASRQMRFLGVKKELSAAPDGAVLVVEPNAADDYAANLASPLAVLSYAASTFQCTPAALAHPAGSRSAPRPAPQRYGNWPTTPASAGSGRSPRPRATSSSSSGHNRAPAAHEPGGKSPPCHPAAYRQTQRAASGAQLPAARPGLRGVRTLRGHQAVGGVTASP